MSAAALAIGVVTTAETGALLDLLARCALPEDGVSDHLAHTLVARRDGAVIGSAGLEVYGDAALLRSVAVAPEERGRGIGDRLTTAAIELARTQGVARLYLLTETAAPYFARRGFEPIPRSEVEPGLHASAEFTGACPESAQAMRLRLDS
jgi:amino-acid N-acetyltransferase